MNPIKGGLEDIMSINKGCPEYVAAFIMGLIRIGG